MIHHSSRGEWGARVCFAKEVAPTSVPMLREREETILPSQIRCLKSRWFSQNNVEHIDYHRHWWHVPSEMTCRVKYSTFILLVSSIECSIIDCCVIHLKVTIACLVKERTKRQEKKRRQDKLLRAAVILNYASVVREVQLQRERERGREEKKWIHWMNHPVARSISLSC